MTNIIVTMKTKILVTLITLIVSIGCESKKEKNIDIPDQRPSTPLNNKVLINNLLDSAILFGNERAYNEVASYYFIEEQLKPFFYYAFTMANKYNNAEACYDVYSIIIYSESEQRPKVVLKNLDNRSKNLALYYLVKSYELGEEKAKYEFMILFNKETPPHNSSYYLNQLEKQK